MDAAAGQAPPVPDLDPERARLAGEDANELWWYRDATPTHSWSRWQDADPQAACPYDDLVATGAARGPWRAGGRTPRHRRVRPRPPGHHHRPCEGRTERPLHPRHGRERRRRGGAPARGQHRGRHLVVRARGGPPRQADRAFRPNLLLDVSLPYSPLGDRDLAERRGRALGTGVEVATVLEPLECHLADGGIGSVSETAGGDPPHHAAGVPVQAWSVAELLRERRLLHRARPQRSGPR